MRHRAPLLLLAAILSASSLSGLPARAQGLDRLSDEHRSWLERDVAYIITDREREVFLSLGTEEERALFIESFWKKRDPNRTTTVNEFKEEHYRRLAHANEYFGRETFREGWRTDRGRYYILLGEPREVQRYVGYTEIVSSELWFYQGEAELGLPSFFYLLFFKQNDFGEYRLYSPIVDGPGALLTGSQFVPGTDNYRAVEALNAISPELAHASLSFDTSDPPDLVSATPALGTELLLARIEESPKRTIRTDYADAALRYRDRVSAEYSFNFVPSRSAFAVFAEPGGTPIVHFSIEIDPENFSLETDEEQTRYYTTLDVTLEVRNEEGELVLANDREVAIELSPSQVQQIRASPFAYQDDFPLVPGRYTVSVILRNRVVRQYAVAETELEAPAPKSSSPSLVDVVLAYDSSTASGDVAPGEIRTFQVGRTQFQPAAGGLFVIGDTVHVAAQAFGAGPEHDVVIEIVDGEEVLLRQETSVAEGGLALDHVRLDDMVGGSFELVARLRSPSGEELSVKRVPLVVSPRSAANRPVLVYRRGFNTRVPGLLPLVLGEQLWNLGRHEEARVELERAVAAANPRLPAARWKLASAYLIEERADEALALLEPLAQDFSRQYEVVAGLGFAHYLKGRFGQAASYLDEARLIRPPDTVLLNTLADSLEKLGRLDEAKETYRRSLEIDPEQSAVEAKLRELSEDQSEGR